MRILAVFVGAYALVHYGGFDRGVGSFVAFVISAFAVAVIESAWLRITTPRRKSP